MTDMEQIEKFNKLKEWLNIKEPNDYLELQIKPYRKVIAKKDIPSDKIIFCISDDKLIDNDTVKELGQFEEYHNKVSSINSVVAIYLIENKDNPRWKPYMDILPKNMDEFWYYIKPEVKELIKNSKLAQEINSFKESRFDADLKILFQYFPKLKEPKYREEWYRAKLLVNSRIFGYIRNGKSLSGLVPMADMLNHDVNPNCTWYYDDAQKGFCMKSNKEIKKGEEVLDSYGSKEGTRYYLLYAFIPHNMVNVNDVSTNINGKEINENTTLDSLLNMNNNDKNKIFEMLISKLKSLPTKKQLKEKGAYVDVITLIGHEKNIIKKLLLALAK